MNVRQQTQKERREERESERERKWKQGWKEREEAINAVQAAFPHQTCRQNSVSQLLQTLHHPLTVPDEGADRWTDG